MSALLFPISSPPGPVSKLLMAITDDPSTTPTSRPITYSFNSVAVYSVLTMGRKLINSINTSVLWNAASFIKDP